MQEGIQMTKKLLYPSLLRLLLIKFYIERRGLLLSGDNLIKEYVYLIVVSEWIQELASRRYDAADLKVQCSCECIYGIFAKVILGGLGNIIMRVTGFELVHLINRYLSDVVIIFLGVCYVC